MNIPIETRIVFNDFLNSYLGQSLSDDVVDIALSNIVITADPLPDSIFPLLKELMHAGIFGTKWIRLI